MKFKNNLFITGSFILLKAMVEELKNIGYVQNDIMLSSLNNKIYVINDGNFYFERNRPVYKDVIKLNLPKDWDRCLQLAKEENIINYEIGKWYLVEHTGQHCCGLDYCEEYNKKHILQLSYFKDKKGYFPLKNKEEENSSHDYYVGFNDNTIIFAAHKNLDYIIREATEEEIEKVQSKILNNKQEAENNNINRISWEEYALALAKTASLRSEDPYVKVGACALRYDKSVAGLGYNGAPKSINIDWSDREERRKRVIHAEVNALSYCKPDEVWLLACNLLPCSNCLQTIAAYGVKKIVFEEVYTKDDLTLQLAKEFGIELIQIKKH